MNLHKMIEICLKDDNMHRFVMINALICINIYVITCINSMLSVCLRRALESRVLSYKLQILPIYLGTSFWDFESPYSIIPTSTKQLFSLFFYELLQDFF